MLISMKKGEEYGSERDEQQVGWKKENGEKGEEEGKKGKMKTNKRREHDEYEAGLLGERIKFNLSAALCAKDRMMAQGSRVADRTQK